MNTNNDDKDKVIDLLIESINELVGALVIARDALEWANDCNDKSVVVSSAIYKIDKAVESVGAK